MWEGTSPFQISWRIYLCFLHHISSCLHKVVVYPIFFELFNLPKNKVHKKKQILISIIHDPFITSMLIIFSWLKFVICTLKTNPFLFPYNFSFSSNFHAWWLTLLSSNMNWWWEIPKKILTCHYMKEMTQSRFCHQSPVHVAGYGWQVSHAQWYTKRRGPLNR